MNRRRFVAVATTLLPTTWMAAGCEWLPGHDSAALIAAVEGGRLDDVRRLLARDRTLAAARDPSGRSAFVLAHQGRHAGVADLLLRMLQSLGAELDIVEAVLARDWDRLGVLASSEPVALNRLHPIGGTAMHAAALIGLGNDMYQVQSLGGNPDANPRGASGVTPAMIAMESPDVRARHETIAVLLGNGGTPNTPQRDGVSLLHKAAELGDATMVLHVLRKGGDPDALDRWGRRPLDVARERGHRALAELLANEQLVARDHRTSRFAYGADGSPYVSPPLESLERDLRNRIVGASHAGVDGVQEVGRIDPAYCHSISFSDEAAVEAGAHTGRREVVGYLLEAGVPYALPTATMMGDLTWMRRLLDEDPVRVHERGAHDFALTWYPAIGADTTAPLELLLAYGAPIGQEYLGTTALHWAAAAGRLRVSEALLELGAEVNGLGYKFSRDGETPLDHAITRGHEEVARLLRQAGGLRAAQLA